MDKELTVLFIGDIIGQPGIRAIVSMLPNLKRGYNPDLIVINGENAADGFGITPEIADSLFAAGADIITTGNHVWQQREIIPYMKDHPTLLRPANYPPGAPGTGAVIVEKHGVRFAVLNLQGRMRMWPIDCPFRKARDLIKKIEGKADIVLIDMHAEAPEEKEALAFDLDGRISALVGTHTHIQTADERILPRGTAYISDLGATGPRNSIIGFDPETGIRRSLTQLPLKSEVAQTPAVVHGVVLGLDGETRRARWIRRIKEQSLV
ncbi:TIGR00282 family metallophosphoesterase [Spirochaeta lutea]|uniref:Metallophosphoesterase n=1 Tax=Spirochaeta lutea TaxID=1480694 RepID=A0A098R299_9SPIO|nr:TIGR00282 family metallophosphoesterase [Spirochaeta lutea]KGE73788.1 metallophosphoesterase [Spirochaeta lutea]